MSNKEAVKKMVTKFTNKIRNALKKEAFTVRASWDNKAQYCGVTLKFDKYELYINTHIVNYIEDNFSVPNVQVTLALDCPNSKGGGNSAQNNMVRAVIEKAMGRRFSGMPWHFETSSRDTLGGGQYITLGKLDNLKTPYNQPERTAPRYDPQTAYLNSLSPAAAARRNRISQHQFADNIGGCAANYRF